MKKNLFLFSLLFLFVGFQTHAQLAVTNGQTGQQLGEILAGDNIQVTNSSISGNVAQYGAFSFTGDELGVNSGVILSSGSIFDAPGPNSAEGTSTDFDGAGNALLTALANSNTYDAVVLQFDFDVQSDEIEFNFTFLSEEYNEYVNAGFNDVFAFYISGPGIDGEENLAVVPGTTIPVTINSINNNKFWQFYNDNETGNTNIEFDGFTTLMTAKKSGLISCETYTLKLMIADAGDGIYDCGVLLQENSLVQAGVSASSSTFSDNNTALEGCIEADFNFQLDQAVDYDVEIPLTIGGTAVNGVDYKYIDPVIIIPAGQTSVTLIIESYSDGMTEGQETIELSFEPAPCQPLTTVSLFIDDFVPIEFSATETGANCNGATDGEVLFTITGGFEPYIINLTDTITKETTSYTENPILGLAGGTYSVEIIDNYGCKAEDIVFGDIFNAGTTFLPTGTGVTYETSINITSFDDGEIIETIDQFKQISASLEHSYANDIEIFLRSPDGTQVKLKKKGPGSPGGNTQNCVDFGEPVSSGACWDTWNANNITPGVGYEYVWKKEATHGTMKYEREQGLLPNHTYTTTFGNELENSVYFEAGSYESFQNLDAFIGSPLNGEWTIIVTDFFINDNGYIFNWNLSVSSPQSDSIITITEPELPEVTTSYTNPDCGVDNGEIDITVTGFTVTDFLWNTGATTEDITGLSSGTYSVNITGDDACDYDYDFNLSNNGTLALSATSDAETCVDADNGTLDLTVTGGTPDFSYSWDNGSTDEDLTGLEPADYTVTVTDAGGCTGIETFTVSAATPIYIGAIVTNENCGDAEGEINLNPTGGVEPFTFAWETGETTQTIDELSQGTYTVTVTDANLCTQSETFTITNYVGDCIPDCDLAFTYENIVDETCGQADGEIDLTIFTSFSPYTVSWDSGETTDDLNSLSANDYTITVTDAEGCELIETYTIENQTSGLEILSTVVTDETCGNGAGEINVTVNGGALPYSFNWDNGSTTEDLTGISGGDYNLIVTDANGCSVNTSASITNQTGDLALTWGNATNEICGNTTGTIDILIEGGNPFGGGGPWGGGFYEYLWSNGSTNEDLLNLSAGNYSCVVTDEDGCQITTPVYVVENEGGTLNIDDIDVDNETCDNNLGEIELVISGGVEPYTFAWNSGQTTQDIFNLSEGTYDNTITDANGCSISTGNLTIINESGTLALQSVNNTDELCNNNSGEIDITIIGGTTPYNYLWNTGATAEDLNALNAGNYSCEITDANGCIVSVNSTINNDNGTIAVSNTIITDENCGTSDGAIDITITGAATPINFNWNSGDVTEDLLNISAGTYNCIITDAMGCETNANGVVDNNSGDLAINNSIVTNEQCGATDGSIDLVVSGSATPLTFLWNNGATTQNITSLAAGTYSCIVTDNNGCSVNSNLFTINNTSSTISVTDVAITNETCGSINGAIDLTISGGQAPITFAWSNGATTEDITNVVAGTYDYTITDNSGCAINGSAEVLNESGDLEITSFSKVNEICGNGNGSIDITVNGASPFNFTWSNGATTEDITGLSAGVFNVTISDDNGCEITSSNYNILNDAGAFELSSTDITNEHCNDGSGAIDIEVANGTEPIDYAWSNSETTQDLTGLSQGVFSCVATDANGCELSYFATVTNIEGNIIVSNEVIENETCGNTNGSISFDISGGVEPYNFAWSNGETTEDITGLSADTYNCVITDDVGCSTTYNTTIENIGGDFAIVNTEVTNENCNNGAGAINITLTGGTEPYTFSWDNGATTEDLAGLSAGTYNLTVTETTGCELTTSAEVINIEGTFVIDNANITDETCGQGNGAIDITYSGANGSVTFNWSNGSPFEDIDNLSSGNYLLTATDETGCVINGDYFVDNITGGFELTSSTVVDETCGNANGSIDLTISGGTTPYVFDWNTGATTEDLENLSAGTYTCEITDAVGCVTNFNTDITNIVGDLAISLDNTVNDVCNSSLGEIYVNATGGTSPYSFSWNTGATTQNLIGVTAGTYLVTVTDATDCSVTNSYEVGNDGGDFDFAFINVYNDECSQGQGAVEFDATPAGTYTYELDGEEGTWGGIFWGLTAGEYTISIVDGACRLDSIITIENESTFNVSNIDVTNENCGDQQGAIDITLTPPNPPYSYNWSNGETTQDISELSAGTYTCEITKLNDGCTDNITVEIEGNSVMDIATNTVNENCGQANGEITVFISGGELPYTFDWSNGETTQNLTDLSAGTYTCEISDNSGCSITISEEIENITNGLTINLLDITNSVCDEAIGAIDITPTGGIMPYNFNWSNGETTEDIFGLTVGSYTIEITDNVGCQTEATYEVESNMGFAMIWIQDDFCSSGQGEVYFEPTEMGDYTYELDGMSQDDSYFMGVTGGEHTISIVSGDCRIDSVITVGNESTFNANVISVTHDVCSQEIGAIDLQVGPGWADYTYNWNNGATTQDISDLAAGIYTCEIARVDDGCTDNIEVEITDENTFSVNVNSVTNDNCGQEIGAIDLGIDPESATYTYNWSNGEVTQDISDLAVGTYTCDIVKIDDGCTDNIEVEITDENTFSVNVNSVTNDNCGQEIGAIDLGIDPESATYTYDWSNGEATQDISDLVAGTYTCDIVKIDDGCTDNIEVEVENNTGTLNVESTVTNNACSQSVGSIELTVTSDGGYTVLWSTTADTDIIENLSAGDYSVVVTETGTGCEFNDDFVIISEGDFTVSEAITNSTCETCDDGAIDLTLTPAGDYTFSWTNGADTEDISNLLPAEYTVTITNDLCEFTDTYIIDFTEGILETKELEISIYPNPANGVINIDYNLLKTDHADIFITDITGKILNQVSINQSKGLETIEIDNLKSGIYFIKINTDGINRTYKFVKTNN